MRFLKTLGTPLPKAFAAAAEFMLNADLRRAVSHPAADPEEVQRLLDETTALGVDLDRKELSYALEQALATLVDNLRERPEDPELLRRVHEAVTLARSAPFQVDLWRAQTRCYELLQTVYPEQLEKAEKGDEAAAEWVSRFKKLGEGLAGRGGERFFCSPAGATFEQPGVSTQGGGGGAGPGPPRWPGPVPWRAAAAPAP